MTSIKEEVVTKPLTELVSLVRGVSYTKGMERREPAPGYIRLLRANNIQGDLVFNDVIYVPHTCVKPDQILRRGDIVVAMSSGSKSVVGKTAQHWEQSEPTTFGAFCGVLRPNASVDPAFLGWFLRTEQYRQFISEISAGVNINNLKREYFEQVEVPTPSLAQQEAIAQIIGALVTATSSPRERLATIPALLKKFRQSVLAAAYDGSVLEGTEGLMLAPKVLRDVVDRIEAGKSFRAEGFPPRDGEPGVIKVSAMTWGEFDPRESKKLLPGTKPNPRTEIKPGDLLFSRANTEELVGATVLVKSTPPNLYLSDKSLRLVTSTGVSRVWLNIVLSAPQVREYFADNATGTSNSMRNISQAKLLVTPLLVPDPKVQEHIAKRVESLFALVDSIESRLTEATAQVDRTTQAILAKAFRGEL